MSLMEKYIILEKAVGETPLSCAEAYRAKHPDLKGVSMAYAGRLDPMASGKLLVLLRDECKKQSSYHGFDKEYEFSVLLGIESDSLDVLGRLKTCDVSKDDNSPLSTGALRAARPSLTPSEKGESSSLENQIDSVAQSFVGNIELPYPIFSAKTVQGKPLHTWTMEGRLDEIEIPTKESVIYSLELKAVNEISRTELVDQALAKVNSVPPVTELRKALGNDFRRVDVRADWENIRNDTSLPDIFNIAHFVCVASSGTYMRTLASEIAKKLDTCGLAWSIHRTKIGTFDATKKIWTKEF